VTAPVEVSELARDELELRRLVESYGVAVDDGDPEAIAALFVPDGALHVYEAGIDEPAYSYRAEDFRRLTDELARAYLQVFHLVATVVVRVDGDHAAGTAYCLASHLRDDGRGAQVVWMPVRYRDRFARTDHGWRFEERVATLLWRERRLANQWPPRP
jgi:hypothetical protein